MIRCSACSTSVASGRSSVGSRRQRCTSRAKSYIVGTHTATTSCENVHVQVLLTSVVARKERPIARFASLQISGLGVTKTKRVGPIGRVGTCRMDPVATKPLQWRQRTIEVHEPLLVSFFTHIAPRGQARARINALLHKGAGPLLEKVRVGCLARGYLPEDDS